MKVVMSADAIRHPLTGIGHYVWHLSDALSSLSEDTELSFLRNNRIDDHLPDLESLTEAQPGAAYQPGLRGLKLNLPGLDNIAERLPWHMATRLLKQANPDVFHGTNFDLLPSDAATVVTIHDLSVLKYPEYHPPTRVRKITRKIQEATNSADVIITVSEAIRRELIDLFQLPSKRICVTTLASAPAYRPLGRDEVASRLVAFGLKHDSYCLFCSTIEPRKNLRTLISAYRKLPKSLRGTYPLVVAGGAGWNNAAELAAMREAELEGWLHYLGYVDQQAQLALFTGCRVFVMPSHYEGFGLPLLEAMACGAACICSTDPALLEVAGDAAMDFVSSDKLALINTLEQGLLDDEWRLLARTNSITRASQFSWIKTAEQTLDAYRRAIESRT
jgi:glycosyltransferase involved in cell wall biosynthesis